MYTGPERRHSRSNRFGQALTLQLESIREDCRLQRLVLGSQDGLAIAPPEHCEDIEILAVLGPRLAGPANRSPRLVNRPLRADKARVSVLRFDVDGETLLLTGVAKGGAPLTDALRRARDGVRRIFASLARREPQLTPLARIRLVRRTVLDS